MHRCMCTVKNKNMLGNSRATARAACEARLLAGSMRADAAWLSCWCTDETPEYAPYGTDAPKPWETTLTRHHLASLQRMDNELLGPVPEAKHNLREYSRILSAPTQIDAGALRETFLHAAATSKNVR